ncbi:hypothetical protein QP351_09400, partial [Aerococcus sp. UMB7533]|nr:hypothetical protein [Aerococcus sp. UMB7533]
MIVEYFSNGPNVSERAKTFFEKTLDTNLRNMILLISRFNEATRDRPLKTEQRRRTNCVGHQLRVDEPT